MSEGTIEELDEFIREQGIAHFSAKETLQLLRLGVQAPVPPRRMWPNIIPALLFSESMRAGLNHPLIIANGYRPKDLNKRVGGARRSQHIQYRALDIQLPRSLMGCKAAQERLYSVAAGLYLSWEALDVGFGVYRRNGGDRVHIDVGFRRRCWGGPRGRWMRDLLAENR